MITILGTDDDGTPLLLGYQHVVWTEGTATKPHTCHACHGPIPKGARHWRPFTNSGMRGQRLCADCAKTATPRRTTHGKELS